MGWNRVWGEEEGFCLGYGLLKRACRGRARVMQREGKSKLRRAQTGRISFFTGRARMCKPENSLCNLDDNFQIWKRTRRRKGGASHIWGNSWQNLMQKQDFSELSLSQSDRHQAGFMSVNRTMQGYSCFETSYRLGWGSSRITFLPSVTRWHEESLQAAVW